jgi:hypothetical protein
VVQDYATGDRTSLDGVLPLGMLQAVGEGLLIAVRSWLPFIGVIVGVVE